MRTISADIAELLNASASISTDGLLSYDGSFLESISGKLHGELQHWRDDVESAARDILADALVARAGDAEHALDWELADKLLARVTALVPTSPQVYRRLLTVKRALGKDAAIGALVKEAQDLFGGDWSSETKQDSVGERTQDDGQVEPRFVGRVAVVNSLRRRWVESVRGRSQLVILRGEAGIGKTRLSDQMQRLVALQGGRSFQARCYEAGRRIAYLPLNHVQRQLLDAFGDKVPSWTIETLSKITLSTGESSRDNTLHDVHIGDIARAFGLLLQTATRATPVLLVVDDCQWIDTPTAELVASARSFLEDHRLMTLCCIRNDPSDNIALKSLLSSADDEIELHGLNAVESSALASYCIGGVEPQHLQELVRLAGGNPFYLIELIRHYEDQGRVALNNGGALPKSVTRVIAENFDSLSAVGQRVVQASALLDGEGTPEVVRRTAGVHEGELSSAVEELISKGFIRRDGDEVLRLRHDLLRQAVCQLLGPRLRAILHVRAARALVKVGATAAAVAEHAKQGGLPRLAWNASLAAGDRAATIHANSDAVHWYEEAMAAAKSPAPHSRAAERIVTLAARGRVLPRVALPYIPLVQRWCQRRGDELGVLRCEYVEVYEGLLSGSMQIAERVKGLASIGERAAALKDHAFALEAYKEAVASAVYHWRREEVASLLRDTVGTAPRTSETSARILAHFAAAFVVCATAAEALEWAEQAVREAQGNDDPVSKVHAFAARGSARWAAGRLLEAEDDFKIAMSVGEEWGVATSYVSGNYALLLADMDRYPEAIARVEALIAGAQSRSHIARANRALLAFELGDLDLSLSLLEDCDKVANAIDAEWLATMTAALRGLISLSRMDVAAAESAWRYVQPRLQKYLASASDPVWVAAFAGRMLVSSGRPADAIRMLSSIAEDTMPRNSVMAAKLRLEMAQLQLDFDNDVTYRLAKDVYGFGQKTGAHGITRRAHELLEQVQLRSR